MDEERLFIDQIFQKNMSSLRRYSLSFLRSFPDAVLLSEECVQETFIVALQKNKDLQKCQSPEGYLMAICRRITMSERRKRLNRQRIAGIHVSIDGEIQIPDVCDPVNEWVNKHDFRWKIQQLFGVLTKQELDVFRIYFEEELSIEECAKKLCLTKFAIMGTVQRIRFKAKKVLSCMEIDCE